jgi:pentatricopeptide repeat protein
MSFFSKNDRQHFDWACALAVDDLHQYSALVDRLAPLAEDRTLQYCTDAKCMMIIALCKLGRIEEAERSLDELGEANSVSPQMIKYLREQVHLAAEFHQSF